MLTSSQNPLVKMVRQLQQRREAREIERMFVAEGARLTDDFIRAGLRVQYAFVDPNLPAQEWKLEHADIHCTDVSDSVMRQMSLESTPPGIMLVFSIPDTAWVGIDNDMTSPVLILDALRDPGNLGACLRVAAGADCRNVLLAPGCVDPYNPKVVRGGMGAHARLKIATFTWDEIVSACYGRTAWAADAGGDRRYDEVAWTMPCALIIGGEATGLSMEARKMAAGIVSIPLSNGVESLNASVACGVILFEAARHQRARSLL